MTALWYLAFFLVVCCAWLSGYFIGRGDSWEG
jgi:hypothetical protein